MPKCEQNAYPFVYFSLLVLAFRPYSWFARLWRWLTHIGRDSIIYPTKLRIRLFALGNIFAGLFSVADHVQAAGNLSLMVAEGICLFVACALLVANERSSPSKPLNLVFYGLAIWYCLFMSNVWAYMVDDLSRDRLLMLLIAIGVYYLMVEWWHVLAAVVLTTVLAHGLFYALGRTVIYPPAGHWVLLLTAHVSWMGFSITNRSKREARLRDTQSLVRYIQRGLQPGLQSLEALMPELRYALAESLQEEQRQQEAGARTGTSGQTDRLLNAAARIQSITKRLQNNTIALEDYFDLQCVNARFNTLEGRLQVLHPGQLLQEVVDAYPYTSDRFKAAVQIHINADFAFLGVREQWMYVLRNLLDNALTAVFCLGLRPRPGDIQIHIDAGQDIGHICFTDKGAGIAPQHLPDMFEPFHAWGKFAGLGLGLSYCKAVTDSAGGRIKVRSDQQQGCKVQVSLPVMQGRT